MRPQLYPWQLLSVIVAGILNGQQQRLIDYLKEENRVLQEQLGNKRIRLSDNQRRRLAVLGKALGHKVLSEICSIVTPDTIMRWHPKLIANKYDGSKSRKPGRPRVMQEIRQLVLRFATENRAWGYERIEGELCKLGHRVARTTVANILREHGLEPAPNRSKRTTWAEFLQMHWESIAAMDFFTVEVWTAKGLTRFHVLFTIDLSTRRVEIAGISSTPHGAWVERVLRRQFDDLVNGVRSRIWHPVSQASSAPVLRASLPRTVGGQQFVVGFDVRFVRFFERQTALNLARIGHEWVNTNDFSRYAPCPIAETWTSQNTACFAGFAEFVAPD